MDRYEETVLDYITANRSRFVSPQFDIPYKNNAGGSCPDFVVVDFEDRTIYVVEVTASSCLHSIKSKIDQRQSRWYEPLRQHFGAINPDFVSWDYRMAIFVRAANRDRLRDYLLHSNDIFVKSIEEVSFGYDKWKWNEGKAKNPLK